MIVYVIYVGVWPVRGHVACARHAAMWPHRARPSRAT